MRTKVTTTAAHQPHLLKKELRESRMRTNKYYDQTFTQSFPSPTRSRGVEVSKSPSSPNGELLYLNYLDYLLEIGHRHI
ncbi:uncharacterized protein LACBIDRAFT_313673 [Laccaria bicolor S238N-H82]|uniref:Predicted protein n=1 Tax=Laccaria bicolor (strain S238N-H82 / ATCC MYA-4686) TaxID=486041 RepID=B0D0J6_LACBS|nr:uncharacterized protein LACBIDRAFT_313673 [Laccaria bicolor S238N-H82]EDR11834.1 predicted protein [Laccaria bicolor S238N-H82]|eukprot:XP_001877731.1 predicted protein [Laccaria bicolor S238N-H82]